MKRYNLENYDFGEDQNTCQQYSSDQQPSQECFIQNDSRCLNYKRVVLPQKCLKLNCPRILPVISTKQFWKDVEDGKTSIYGEL